MHVLAFQHNSVVQALQYSLENLNARMGTENTHPDICCIVKEALTVWKGGNEFQPSKPLHPLIAKVFQEQENLGWQEFLGGCISTKWPEFNSNIICGSGRRK